MTDKITVAQAAALHGYNRFVATFDDNGSDVPKDTILVKKTNEIEGNRVWYLSESGHHVEISRLFVMSQTRG